MKRYVSALAFWAFVGCVAAVADPAAAQAPKLPAAATAEDDADAEQDASSEAGASGARPAAASGASSAAKAPPDVPVCDPKVDICLVAEAQGREKGHIWARGFADIRMGDLRIQADSLDIYDVENAGVTTQRMTAAGNVVLLRRQERMAGTKLSMDLDSGRGTMDNVVGYVDPGVFLTAKQVERVDSKTFRIKSGRFTSCCQAKPRWSFSAHRATLKVGKRIAASGVHFDLGVPQTGQQLPFLFLPYLLYPIKEDGRATGFLLPSFNIDINRGVDLREGFFLTMGRSADQTFAYEHRASGSQWSGGPETKFAPQLIHELRWNFDRTSWGTLQTTYLPPITVTSTTGTGDGQTTTETSTKRDWDFEWKARQILPGRIQAVVTANIPARQENLTGSDRRFDTTRTFNFALQRSFAGQLFQVVAHQLEKLNYYDDSDPTAPIVYTDSITTTRRKLPSISLSQTPRGIGRTRVRWGYTARVDYLSVIKKRDGVTFRDDRWRRFDFTPSIDRTFRSSFLNVTPTLAARYSLYSKSCPAGQMALCDRNFRAGAVKNSNVSGTLDMGGPTFSRIFRGPKGFSDLIKHTIGPEFVWVYRQATDNYERIPQFKDRTDDLARAHDIRYGLVQRLSGRRKSASGAMQSFDFVKWSILQRRYFLPPKSPNDPPFTTVLFYPYLPAPTDRRYSPIRSELKLSPAPQWSFEWLMEYDFNRPKDQKRTTRLELRMDIAGSLGELHGNWARRPALLDEAGNPRPGYQEQDALTGSAGLAIGKWLQLGAAASYSLIDNTLYQVGDVVSTTGKGYTSRSIQATIDAQCIALKLRLGQQSWGWDENGKTRYSTSFGFTITLANLGSIGMDPGPGGAGLSLGGRGLR